MKIKCYYRKNLKMTEGKLAAQVGHVCKELGKMYPDTIPSEDVIIVLKLSDKKFQEELDKVCSSRYAKYWVQIDKGFTEVLESTITCFGYITPVTIND